MNALHRLASLRLTMAIFVVFLLGVLLAHLTTQSFSLIVTVCCSLWALNLIATLITNGNFRSQPALLVFHLALLTIVILVATGRLIYLNGQAEVLEGQAFDGRLVSFESGRFHPWSLKEASFVNHGFQVRYAPGLKRLETSNRVSWTNSRGVEQTAMIGDDKPLLLKGYRFYTTWNKGFSLVFEWQPKGATPLLGSVNLPGYPGNALKQAQQWQLPGLPEPVWAMLQFEGDLIPLDREGEFRLPDDYKVVVRYGEQRWELNPADSKAVDLPGGQLRYVGLTTWMGYLVTWDATIPWLLLASTIAVLALSWHFWQKYSRRPWNPD
jgi:cytochrome c biogenesis protein